ncbi:restriction endonuclease subunit S [Arsukibacterium perlucidum]|uniref:restriction endonuclease subunit S n=1 Tax=Arsukibacterium perlucidum TaxID=368811 RepID=UPI000382A8A2|nr:restriction endonuclease subunit S [Arsukibacterium perlucidum]
MSSEWGEITLGEVCAAQNGAIQTGPFGSQLHASDYVETGIPVVMPSNIGPDGGISEDGIARIKQQDADRLSQHKLQIGDVVFSRRGDVTRNALIEPHQVGWLCGTGCLKVRLGDETKADAKFISYCLRSPETKEWLIRHAVGATMPNLNTSILSAVPIQIPPISEQKKITELLRALDDRIDLLRETNATLEAIAQALFKSWFVDFDPVHANAGTQAPSLPAEIQALFPSRLVESPQGLMPEGWEVKPFGELLTHTIGGDWGDELPTDKNNVRVAIIRGTDLPDLANGSYGRVPLRFTNEKKLSSRKLQDGDLVLEVSGGSKDQPTGRSLYLTTGMLNQFDCPMEPASFCRLLRPSSPEIGVVLAQHLTYIYALGKTWEYQNQSTGISNFQTTHFLETELVVVPDTKVLKAFFEIARPMVDRANLTQMTKLAELRDTLLPRLISGQLRLPEAEAAFAEVV